MKGETGNAKPTLIARLSGWQTWVRSDLGLLILVAVVRVLLHLLVNGQYGFHRDELDTLDNARRLAWGYVAYPPVTPFLTRLGFELLGPSLVGLRLFPALAQGVVMVLVGLMARDLGGGRLAQIVTVLAVAASPIALTAGLMFHYLSYDYLWWVVIAYCLIRLLKREDGRWWLGIGAAIGLGMMTKYTLVFFVAGLAAGVLLTPARRWLRSPWLWGGAALSLLIFLPNLLWQVQHNFITLEFLRSIHARDIAWGRTDGFLTDQLYVAANAITLPLWVAGLFFYLVAPEGKRYRTLGWLYLVLLVLLLAARGRGYYLAPAYPMLLAAGAVWWEKWLKTLSPGAARQMRHTTVVALAVGIVIAIPLSLPVSPINSTVWQIANGINDNFREMIGWPELVETVAAIYHELPATEQAQTAILTANYGQLGAINLYGPAYGLPEAISGINSAWERGYGDPPPQTVILLGFGTEGASRLFRSCEVAGRVTNRYDVANEESSWQPIIMLCRQPRQPWPDLWPHLRSFG